MFQGSPVWDGQRKVRGYQQIVDLSVAVGLTVPAANPDRKLPRLALIRCEGKSVRWRDDATDPTALIGMPMNVGDMFLYTGDLAAIKFIQTAASAALNVSYYE